MKFNVIGINGEKHECNKLFSFKDEINNINYIVYTDGTKDSDGELKIFSSRYVLRDECYILEDIESEYEWNLIDNMIASRFDEVSD